MIELLKEPFQKPAMSFTVSQVIDHIRQQAEDHPAGKGELHGRQEDDRE